MNSLLNYLNQIKQLNSNEINLVNDLFTLESIKRGNLITRVNAIPNYVYFLKTGVVKGFQIDDDKYIVNHLIEPLNFFVDFENFKNRKPAMDIFEAITDCTLLKLSKSNFDRLLNETTFFKSLISIITNNALICKMERLQNFQKLTAKERYLKLLKENPNLINNVSINDLSSYLGITPPSLSRIRKQIF